MEERKPANPLIETIKEALIEMLKSAFGILGLGAMILGAGFIAYALDNLHTNSTGYFFAFLSFVLVGLLMSALSRKK